MIDIDGKSCKCGRKGCFERYASITALKEMICNEFNLEENITGLDLYNYIIDNKDKEKINNILEEYTKYLSIGISNIINIFEPQAIILGGSIVHYESLILNRLKDKLETYNWESKNIDIKMAILGNDAGIIGSLI